MIPGIAFAKGGKLAFASTLALILAAVLIARFDSQAALRPLHLWANLLQWLLLVMGVGLGTLFFFRQKERFFKVLKLSLICVSFSGLILSPWLLKNAWETRSIRISSLTRGKKAGPQPTVLDIEKAYQNQKDGN